MYTTQLLSNQIRIASWGVADGHADDHTGLDIRMFTDGLWHTLGSSRPQPHPLLLFLLFLINPVDHGKLRRCQGPVRNECDSSDFGGCWHEAMKVQGSARTFNACMDNFPAYKVLLSSHSRLAPYYKKYCKLARLPSYGPGACCSYTYTPWSSRA